MSIFAILDGIYSFKTSGKGYLQEITYQGLDLRTKKNKQFPLLYFFGQRVCYALTFLGDEGDKSHIASCQMGGREVTAKKGTVSLCQTRNEWWSRNFPWNFTTHGFLDLFAFPDLW